MVDVGSMIKFKARGDGAMNYMFVDKKRLYEEGVYDLDGFTFGHDAEQFTTTGGAIEITREDGLAAVFECDLRSYRKDDETVWT